MPLTTIPLPFGLRDVKLAPLTVETPGTAVDLPNAQTLTFAETEDFEELRGDDATVAVHGLGATVDWELGAGGISLEALAVINGGTIAETGVTPNQVKTYSKEKTDARPYFTAIGKAISDSGGDFWVRLYRCKATGEISGEMTDGSFWVTSCSGRAIGQDSDGLIYEFIQHETETAVTFA